MNVLRKKNMSESASSHYFCPSCGNLLLIDSNTQGTQLRCRSCRFVMDFQGKKVQKGVVAPLDVASLMISEDNFTTKQITEAKCEKCGNNEAWFQEIQIRSADEPATLFFCCTKCKNKWREG